MPKAVESTEIRLTPHHSLVLQSPAPAELEKYFSKDWREGWFHLGAQRKKYQAHPSLDFWQDLAYAYLTQLCHLPPEQDFSRIASPGPDQMNQYLMSAPPMTGGEYLNTSSLEIMWEQLNDWVQSCSRKSGGIHPFLSERAPKWQQVGRVCFHLAENKKDPERPFAFLATYSTGFGANGRLKHLPLKKALEQYSGSDNRQALVKLLTPVKQAADRCTWLDRLVKSSEVYHPLGWTAQQAYPFLSSIPELEDSGLSVKIPNWWKKRSKPLVSVKVGAKSQPSLGVQSLLDFQVEVALGDQSLSAEELQQIAQGGENLVFLRGQWVEVNAEKLQEALDHWKEVQEHARNGEISFIDGMRLLAGAPSSLQDSDTVDKQSSWLSVSAGDALANLLAQLRDPSLIPAEQALEGVQATLRHYQEEGVKWMNLLSGLGLGSCLADDMGLGKTLQILSLLVLQQKQKKDSDKPSLLVVPASLLGNWKREAERFTPSLKLLLIHPSECNKQYFEKLKTNAEGAFDKVDLVVTTYSMVVRQEFLSQHSWNLLILDEAQAIKNSGTKQTRAIKALKSRARIALTGTPIENRLSDLWSLFDFLNPGLLGSSKGFADYVKGLSGHGTSFEPLRKLVAPYILRRMKTDPKIISDLPDKIETQTYCQLSPEQASLYQSTVEELKKSLENIEPMNRRGLVLQTLLRLKQICNHPSQCLGNDEYGPKASGKFARLTQICEELASRQERVLIFTQFSEIIEPLSDHLSRIFGRSGLILHGGTPVKKRKELVETFQHEDGPPFFVLSLKAGGTGLTLTAASHVIHFDRWWNPAVENQATDRAFRIGQKKNVQVHKFITQGTVEEQIDKIIETKQALSQEILGSSDEVKITELGDEELLQLVSLDINRARMA